jgi:hypothetical protein
MSVTPAQWHCVAKRRDGKRCTQARVRGATVCKMHGGSAPQVRDKARQRLLEAADPAAARLVELLDSEDESVRLRAACALLDRAGLGPTTTQVNVDGGQLDYVIHGVNMDEL